VINDSYAEGIGQTRVTKNLEGIVVDEAYRIWIRPHWPLFTNCFGSGLFSAFSGINIIGAAQFAKQAGPGQTIVTVLCDSATNTSRSSLTLEWLAEHNLDPINLSNRFWRELASFRALHIRVRCCERSRSRTQGADFRRRRALVTGRDA
jgi:hypothetical protein